MKILFITSEVTPYRVAFCDEMNRQMIEKQIGELDLFLLFEQGIHTRYDSKQLDRDYSKYIKGYAITMKDKTTRFLFNPMIVKEVKKNNPDIIILGGAWCHPTTLLILLSGIRKQAPIYFWTESHYNVGIARKQKRNWKENLKKIIYNHFDGFIIPGRFSYEALKQMNCKNIDNLIYLPNLIKNDVYIQANNLRNSKSELREKYGYSQDSKIIFSSSRLVDLKGIVEVLENGKSAFSGITWIIAGIGNLRDKIVDTARDNGVDLRLIGFVDQSVIVEHLALADWFILPSLMDPNPLSVIEALWAGLPLLLSEYVGNWPETIVNGVNGYLFNPKKQEDVERVLGQVKNSPTVWLEKASEKSIKIAKDNFDIVEEVRKFLSEIIIHNPGSMSNKH